MRDEATFRVKAGLAEMLKGGVIMDVVDAEQAKIAEDAGAAAVMALERVPADIRRDGGVARMSDPDLIDSIKAEVSIPVMAKARIGHFVEAQVLQALEVDYIDESEVLSPADYVNHIDKWNFTIPFVCGATNLGEALRRITEGAAMIRSKGEAGTGDVSNAVTHMRTIRAEIRRLSSLAEDAGADAVMALERVPADIRAQGGVSRMSDPDMIDKIIEAVSVPVMAKARIGHFVEAQVLQSLGVDYIDES
jgi:pyridoxal 5'-phosphate synthase pdxS subunit